ncbi:MAG: 3-hydroxybutyryl-CoA dehydrogenase [Actinobacteria bacterium]|nr:3-hydroxybutyryl-CoA dehydrogenase [Actinomycetota bacterium]
MPGESIGVIGCGTMGAGIVEVCARAGLQVAVVDQDLEVLESGRDRIRASLERARTARKLEGDPGKIMSRISFSSDLKHLVSASMIFEAIIEEENSKRELFTTLAEVLTDPDTVLATNTSSIPIMKLAAQTTNPGNVIGIHFFNPVPVMSLVELVPSLLTDEATIRRAEAFVSETLGKNVIRSQDRAGFVVNALLIPYLLSAIRMVESGFASSEDIDTGMIEGCRHPMGPLALADLIGLDTVMAVSESLYEEFREAHYSPPPLLSRMVQAGLTGRKAGRGFYDYG